MVLVVLLVVLVVVLVVVGALLLRLALKQTPYQLLSLLLAVGCWLLAFCLRRAIVAVKAVPPFCAHTLLWPWKEGMECAGNIWLSRTTRRHNQKRNKQTSHKRNTLHAKQ